jgi:hypothetical protein
MHPKIIEIKTIIKYLKLEDLIKRDVEHESEYNLD